jgi:hypothetical protein
VLSFVRPAAHSDFAAEASNLLGEVRREVQVRGVPHTDDFKKRSLWSGSWKNKGTHKRQLCGHQDLAKCAWCERVLPSSRELDVEHYRPKTEVTEWVGAPELVSGTPPKENSLGPGYWWLAFEWTNYSLACKTCNQAWKRNLFPVVTRQTCVEGVERSERPLLLDPGTPFRTADHFSWDPEGYMRPESLEGEATIRTCGLNRPTLVPLRFKAYRALEPKLRACISELKRTRRPPTQILAEIASLGERTAEFAGMIRWWTEWSLRPLRWEEIEGFPP